MANIFTITTVRQTLKADAEGQATTVFTVTNSTSRPLRGIVKIRPLGNTQAQWLAIEGETERDFSAGGTHQFTVTFKKPKVPAAPDTAPQPAESFPFRVDAVSAINPDEDFTEGPVVTVETAAGQPLPVKKPFPWWILIVAGILLVVGIVVTLLLLRGDDAGGDPTPTPTPTVTPTLTPTVTPTVTPTLTPVPAVTRVIYDFIEKAPTAVWKNDLGAVLTVNGVSEPGGLIKIVRDAQMESDFTEAVVLHTHPRWEINGTITGTYDLPEPINAKDRFRARIGFLKGARAGNLRVRVLLNGTVIGEMPKAYDGTLREFEIDLARYQGQAGKIALQAIAAPAHSQGWICWANPRIERVP
jgi:hypothetical protein